MRLSNGPEAEGCGYQVEAITIPCLAVWQTHRGNAGAKAQVGGGAVRDAQPAAGKLLPLRLVQHAAVREPAVVLVPADAPVEKNTTLIPLRSTLAAVLLLLFAGTATVQRADAVTLLLNAQ